MEQRITDIFKQVCMAIDFQTPEQTAESLGEQAPVLVLGAGRNIGLGIARWLIAQQRPVILTYRRHPDEVVRLQLDHPELVRGTIALDARTAQSVERCFGKVRAITESLSGLIDCIGPIAYLPLGELDDDAFDEIMQGNPGQFFAACTRAYPLLAKNGGGRVITFTMAGIEKLAAYRKVAAYAAAKTAMLSLVRSFAVEWAADRITVNAIAPGIVARVGKNPQGDDDPQAFMRPKIPMGRLATERDILAAVAFFMSEEAAYVTGQNLAVAGGFGL
jgi:3-oxoacyl-[acyl-carrier protein] reductase